jgi:hypothetical protein
MPTIAYVSMSLKASGLTFSLCECELAYLSQNVLPTKVDFYGSFHDKKFVNFKRVLSHAFLPSFV